MSAINGNVPAAREIRAATESKANEPSRDPPDEVRLRVVYEETPRVKRSEPENSGSDGSGNGAA
jgi:hypothetical protein